MLSQVYTHVPMLRVLVVSDLDTVEAQRTVHPELANIGRAGVVDGLPLLVLLNFGLSHGAPLGVNVPVTLVVHWCHPQGDIVVDQWVQTLEVHHQSWEQVPRGKEKKAPMFRLFFLSSFL